MRDYPGATQALCLYRDLGNRNGEAEVLNHNGTLHRKLGNPGQALAHQPAPDLARAVSSPLEQAEATQLATDLADLDAE